MKELPSLTLGPRTVIRPGQVVALRGGGPFGIRGRFQVRRILQAGRRVYFDGLHLGELFYATVFVHGRPYRRHGGRGSRTQ